MKHAARIAFATVAIGLSSFQPAKALRLECSTGTVTSCAPDIDGTIKCSSGETKTCEWVLDNRDLWMGPTGPLGPIGDGSNGRPGGRILTDKSLGREVSVESSNTCPDITSRPVEIATGNKMLVEPDFAAAPTNGVPLALVRTYNKALNRLGAFGQSWSSSLEYTLSFDHAGTQCHGRLDTIASCSAASTPTTTIYANRPTGFGWPFTLSGSTWQAENGAQIVANGSGWKLTTPEGGTETYDANGRPLAILDERGIGLTYTYNSTTNALWQITHTSGKFAQFAWANGKIALIGDPSGKTYTYAYSGQKLTGVTYPDNLGVRTYYYENASFPYAITGIGINGVRYSRYSYKTDGRAAWSGLEGGAERSTFTYGTNYTDVQNALGQTTHYDIGVVNGASRVLAMTRPATATCSAGIREAFFDAHGNVDYQLDAFNVKTDFTYDADDRLTTKISGIGPAGETDQQQITEFFWDASNKTRLNKIKVYGNSLAIPLSETTYTYYPDGDAKARLLASVSIKNLSASGIANNTLTTTYSYTLHPNGMIASMTTDGPLSGTSDAVVSIYDSAGNLTSTQNSLGHATTYATYNAIGQPGSITGPNGDKFDYTYNARGSILTEKRWVGSTAYTTTNEYNTRGQRVKTTFPDGETIEFSYDSFDRPVSMFKHLSGELDDDPSTYNDEVWESVTTTYNLNSQPTGHTKTSKFTGKMWDDILGKAIPVNYTTTQYQDFIDYDVGGFVSARRGNNGQNIRYTYNANGDLSSVTDSLNHVMTYGYDRLRRVNHVTSAANAQTWLTYDPVGQLLSVKDPRNFVTSYTYDGFGQLWSRSSPDTGTTTFLYNNYGQRTSMTRQDGSSLLYTYDGLSRLKTVGNGTKTRTYSYDSCTNGKSRLCGFGTSGGGATDSTSLTYTAQGQIATRTDHVNGATDVTGYTYDGAGRLVGIGYPSGIAVGYGYVKGLLTQITATVNGVTSPVAGLSGYQVFGPAVYLSYGNGAWRQSNFDTDARLTGISTHVSSGLIQSLTYGFDANNQMTAITNGVEAGLSQTFGYDSVMRMNAAAVPGGNAVTFAYDLAGNRTGRTDSAPSSATTYTYSSTNNRLVQSAQGALTRSYSVNANGDTYAYTGPDGITNQLTYDPFGRVSTHVRSGITTTYSVNAQDERVAKVNPGTNSRFIYEGQNQLLAEYTNGQWTSYVWNGNEPVALVRNGQTYYIHADHTGRPDKVTNSSQATVWKANNWGFNSGPVLDSIGGLNLGFPGQYWDSESGLWHNGFRDYDYSTGRYLQSDPIGLTAGTNSYLYVNARPMDQVDTLGLRDVVVAIWRAQASPFSVGHVFVGEVNGNVILSQFPSPHATHGDNMTYNWSATLSAEGRQPDSVWKVTLANDEAFNSAATALRNKPFWDALPKGNETNCSVAAFGALQAGGLKLYGGDFLPGAVDTALLGQYQLGNPNIVPLSAVPW